MRDIRIACPGVPAVYIFSLNALEAEIGTAVAFAALDDTARASLERISSKPRRIELLFGRFVTIQLLAQRLNIDAAEVRVRKGSFGKPELDRASYMSSVHFNISHSRDMLAVALCSCAPIGVDIEWTNTMSNSDLIAIGAQYFHAVELGRVVEAASKQRRTEFFRIWTLKEATLKALGLGLSVSLTSIIVPEPAGMYRIDVSGLGNSTSINACHWDWIADGLHVAVASGGNVNCLEVHPLHTLYGSLGCALHIERESIQSQLHTRKDQNQSLGLVGSI